VALLAVAGKLGVVVERADAEVMEPVARALDRLLVGDVSVSALDVTLCGSVSTVGSTANVAGAARTSYTPVEYRGGHGAARCRAGAVWATVGA
jgi:hypothetical protein